MLQQHVEDLRYYRCHGSMWGLGARAGASGGKALLARGLPLLWMKEISTRIKIA